MNAQRTIGKILTAGMLCMAGSWNNAYARTISVPSIGIKTIGAAVARAAMGDTIWVDKGVYREHVMLAPGMALMARESFKAVISGRGRGTAVTLGKNNTISGFEIRNSTIGVFSNGEGNIIRNCRIVNNWLTGVVVVRHLPLIEDNIIAFNRASGIQGWDVRSTAATVNHNTIAFNGNHGIAVGGSSNIVIENNVIAYNERFGMRILPEAEGVRINANNLYRNLMQQGGVPKGNYAFDPAFIEPRWVKNFQSNPRVCCQIKGTDNENLGARQAY
jgi:parallel beta-helix repeat protein